MWAVVLPGLGLDKGSDFLEPPLAGIVAEDAEAYKTRHATVGVSTVGRRQRRRQPEDRPQRKLSEAVIC